MVACCVAGFVGDQCVFAQINRFSGAQCTAQLFHWGAVSYAGAVIGFF
jgi:hypothetical protein